MSEDEEAANLLNEYFSSVFTHEECSNIPVPTDLFQRDIEKEGLLNIKITEEIVERKLEKLNVNKCPGIDEIHPKMLLELRKYLVEPLTMICRSSLESGIVPSDWKDAGVVPLLKKGNRADPKNYRPVSLTSIVCKY